VWIISSKGSNLSIFETTVDKQKKIDAPIECFFSGFIGFCCVKEKSTVVSKL